MSNVILSTKKSTNMYKKTMIITGIFSCIIGLIAVMLYFFFADYAPDVKATILLLFLGLYLLVTGIIDIALKAKFAMSYIEIYDDYIKGKCIQNSNVLDFSIKLSQLKNVSVGGKYVYLHTDSGVYKIMVFKDTSAKIMEYLNNRNTNI